MNLFLFITSETYKKSSILGLKGFSSRNTVNFQILTRKWTKFVARNVGFLAFIVSLRYVPHILPYRASRSGNSLENQGHKQALAFKAKADFHPRWHKLSCRPMSFPKNFTHYNLPR